MDVKHIHCTIEKLAEFMYNEACTDLKSVDTEEYGKVVDMVKDLAEAEYYARISAAMKKSEEEDEEEAKYILKQMKEEYGDEGGEEMYRRMGYNRNRYSNGRFAPRGRGRRMGYMPPEMRYPYFEDMIGMDEYEMMMPMGYGNGRGGNSSMGGNRGNSGNGGNRGMNSSNRGGGDSYGYSDGRGEGSRYGRSYDSYRENRRHYTETKDEKSKKDMEMSMKEYTEDVMDNIKEMWRDADPALRQTMKADLTKMVQQLQ